MQYHQENLEQSVDTPGENEMLGLMDRGAYGKLGGSPTTGGPEAGAAPQGRRRTLNRPAENEKARADH